VKNNQKITRFLVVLALGIWGMIAYRLFASLNSGDSGPTKCPAYPGANDMKNSEQFVYTGDIRDPFEYAKPIRKDTVKRKAPAKAAFIWSPPPFKLSGIVTAERKKTAMLEAPDGAVFFLREKDTLYGMKILKITAESVEYFYQKKKSSWMLDKSF